MPGDCFACSLMRCRSAVISLPQQFNASGAEQEGRVDETAIKGCEAIEGLVIHVDRARLEQRVVAGAAHTTDRKAEWHLRVAAHGVTFHASLRVEAVDPEERSVVLQGRPRTGFGTVVGVALAIAVAIERVERRGEHLQPGGAYLIESQSALHDVVLCRAIGPESRALADHRCLLGMHGRCGKQQRERDDRWRDTWCDVTVDDHASLQSADEGDATSSPEQAQP